MQRSFTDQLGRTIVVDYPPRLIVSLVPSQTELLFDLGLDDEIVGVTKFCVHPMEKITSRTKIGGTKNLNIDRIRALKPDLIIGNKEENEKEQIEELMAEFPVWISDIASLEDAKKAISAIGGLINRVPEAAYLNHLIHVGFADLHTLAIQKNIHKKVAYLIWQNPIVLTGKDTFISDILTIIGLTNVIDICRYPIITPEELTLLKPDFIFLSSEPYPFKETHVATFARQFPEAKVMLVDGEVFSWYGSRLVKAVQYLFQLQDSLV